MPNKPKPMIPIKVKLALSKRKVRLILAIMLGLGMFGIIGALIFIEIPQSNSDILKVFLGFIGASFLNMISHYFGDSEGA